MTNKNMTKYFFNLLMAFATIACSSYSADVERALKLAGENRAELEKVLEHYKDDPLKYKATVFLIGNMPDHYSYSDTMYLNTFYHELDSVFYITKDATNVLKDSLFRQVKEKYSTKNLTLVSDVSMINSAFLISNIDHAFSVWQNEKLAVHLNFEEFCEYILPYKVCETQIFENWRLFFDDFADESLYKASLCKLYRNSVLKACEFVNMELKNHLKTRLTTENSLPLEVRMKIGLHSQIPIRRLSTLSKIPFGSCDDYTELATAVMRTKGIPVAIDFTPQWAFRSLGHNWNVLFDASGKKIVFEGCNERPGMPHKEDHIMAKVYRKTYAVNSDIEKIHHAEKYVPEIFRNVFMKDVTHEYISTVDVDIKVSDPNKSKYAYLAVFNNINWAPVGWGKISFGKATFKNIGKDILYLPVNMGVNGLLAIADPVIVGFDGKITSIKADTLHKQKMVLDRKYPVFPHVYDVMHRVLGGQIQASDSPDFDDFVIFHTITQYGTIAEDVFLENTKKFRYWRFFSPKGGNCNMAELHFFEKDSTNSIRGQIIGTSDSFWNDGKNEKEAAFDGDALTFFDAPYGDSWVGMDFGKPVAIDRVYYLPRNDGNCIEIGDDYQLVFWSDNQWKSLGKQKATGARLIFEDCPSNGLYLLHNHTKGQEERIFTYENGKQVWW